MLSPPRKDNADTEKYNSGGDLVFEGVDCLVGGCCWVGCDAEGGGGGCGEFDYLEDWGLSWRFGLTIRKGREW